jgi:flagellar basal-body rod protein FlgG
VVNAGSGDAGQRGLDPAGQLHEPGGPAAAGAEPYIETAASGTANGGTPGTNGRGTLQQGYVETSNVNVVEELVSMIQTQRAYEINSKAIQTSDQMLQKLNQI